MVTFCCFISHLIGRETINITEVFSGIHCFTRKTLIFPWLLFLIATMRVQESHESKQIYQQTIIIIEMHLCFPQFLESDLLVYESETVLSDDSMTIYSY